MARAIAGAEREQREGASGKWVAHWKMVHIVRPVWEKAGEANQLGRAFPRLTYAASDADGLLQLEPAPRTIRGARDLISVALQYGNAFGRGFQAAALKPADFFGNDDVLYLMEDMATGEIRLSILWEWVHKGARMTAADPAAGVAEGDPFTLDLCRQADRRGVRQAAARRATATSTTTRRPRRCRSRARSSRRTSAQPVKLPWYVDLLNINLGRPGPRDGAARGSRATRRPSPPTARGSRKTWTSRDGMMIVSRVAVCYSSPRDHTELSPARRRRDARRRRSFLYRPDDGSGGRISVAESGYQVTTSFWNFGRYGGFGPTLLPLLAGIGFLFYNGKSMVGWVLTGLGAAIILAGILMHMDIYFRQTSLFNTILMLGLFVGGLGLIARSLRSA